MQLVKLSKPKFQGVLWQDLEWTSRVEGAMDFGVSPKLRHCLIDHKPPL